MSCTHENFNAFADVNRLTTDEGGPVTGYSVDLTIACRDCGEPFVFHGGDLNIGVTPGRPTLSLDGRTAHLPGRLASDPEDFGLDGPGFVMRLVE